MNALQTRIAELIEQHGSLRAAARVLMTDAGHLSRLGSGEKDNPGDTLLRRMGLRRVVTFESMNGADNASPRSDRPDLAAPAVLHLPEDRETRKGKA